MKGVIGRIARMVSSRPRRAPMTPRQNPLAKQVGGRFNEWGGGGWGRDEYGNRTLNGRPMYPAAAELDRRTYGARTRQRTRCVNGQQQLWMGDHWEDCVWNGYEYEPKY